MIYFLEVKNDLANLNLGQEETSLHNVSVASDETDDEFTMLLKSTANQRESSTNQFLPDERPTLETEIKQYLKCHVPSSTTDILEWWHTKSKEFVQLSKAARMVFAVPASSATSERMFICGSNYSTVKRNRFEPSKVEDLVYLHTNSALIKEFEEN